MMTQTLALFVDAYRELNAKKLFWITMILSGLVVAIYAAIGINEQGVHFLWFRLGFLPDTMNSATLPPAMLYKQLFLNLGIGIWLTWIAAVLALISTAGIVPEMISGGSIEMLLSKPISRLRLLITKYFCGLLFAALQVGVFTVASFMVIGIRGGEWEPKIFLAIPIVVCFFSYLFGVCALIGVITRSTIAALLLTLLFWFLLFVVNTADQALLGFKSRYEVQQQNAELILSQYRENATDIIRNREREEPLPDDYVASDDEIQEVFGWFDIEKTNNAKADAEESLERLAPWVDGLFIAKTVLPKTQETVALLERNLVSMDENESLANIGEERTDPSESQGEVEVAEADVSLRLQEIIRGRSTWWVVGTSLLFELLVVGIGAWIFSRRDH